MRVMVKSAFAALMIAIAANFLADPVFGRENPDRSPINAQTISVIALLVFLYLMVRIVTYVVTVSDDESLDKAADYEAISLLTAQKRALVSLAREKQGITEDEAKKFAGSAEKAKQLLEALIVEDQLVYDEKWRRYNVR